MVITENDNIEVIHIGRKAMNMVMEDTNKKIIHMGCG